MFSAEIDWKLRGVVDQFVGFLISTGSRNCLVWAIEVSLGFSAKIDWRLRGAVNQFSRVLISTGSRN